ncbi:MAG TPA: HEAT repeat domain-containing protein [Puia sp.]|nr:HEAT repeat domain-containing protein [Puia sp.]
MKCERDKEQITRWINHQMTLDERTLFEIHLAQCPSCRQELEASQQVWDLIGKMPVPEPSAAMPVRFHAMLDTYKRSVEEKRNPLAAILERFRQLWALQPRFPLAYSLILVVMGLTGGYLLDHRNPGPDPDFAAKKQIDTLSSQVHEMKEMVMLSLLENPSASERIRGVSYTNEIRGVNKRISDALLETLNNDPNVNVRLMTLDALTHFANDPVVREGLVQSIVQQESPLVQSALADVMLKLQERRSVQPFKKLLFQKDLNGQVRSKIEQTISRLI